MGRAIIQEQKELFQISAAEARKCHTEEIGLVDQLLTKWLEENSSILWAYAPYAKYLKKLSSVQNSL